MPINSALSRRVPNGGLRAVRLGRYGSGTVSVNVRVHPPAEGLLGASFWSPYARSTLYPGLGSGLTKSDHQFEATRCNSWQSTNRRVVPATLRGSPHYVAALLCCCPSAPPFECSSSHCIETKLSSILSPKPSPFIPLHPSYLQKSSYPSGPRYVCKISFPISSPLPSTPS